MIENLEENIFTGLIPILLLLTVLILAGLVITWIGTAELSKQRNNNAKHNRCELATPVTVVMHRPEDEVLYGCLHPAGSLYQSHTSVARASAAVDQLASLIKTTTGARVKTVRQVLEESPHASLVELALKSVTWSFDGSLSNEAKAHDPRETLDKYENSDLVKLIFTRPTVNLTSSLINTGYVVTNFNLNPLSNLVFTRDQQIITQEGVVIGALNSPQRSSEVAAMEYVWKELGIPVVGEVPKPGTLEGGDFMILNPNTSLLGVGLRTNIEAARYLLDNKMFGTDRVALVIDDKDKNQDRMHLDTYFNVIDDKHVLLLDTVVESEISRHVEEYEYDQKKGVYKQIEGRVEFAAWLKAKGYTIITVSNQQQQEYMLNFLNLGFDKAGIVHIAAVHPGLENVLVQNNVKGVHVHHVEYGGVTAMFGAAHCTTQVIRKGVPREMPHQG